MREFVVYGVPGSPFLRSACIALEEKRQLYRIHALAPGDIGGAGHRELHPFARIPVIEHDGFRLYETQAILRYIDDRFPEPPLQPRKPRDIARMNQFIGINDCYLFPQAARIIVFQRIVGPVLMGLTPDETVVTAALPTAELCLREIARLRGDQRFLVGDCLTLADILLAPQLDYLAAIPECAAMLAATPLLSWLDRMNARASLKATLPPEALRAIVPA